MSRAQSILKRYEAMRSRDANFRSLWQDTADLEWPRQNNINRDVFPGREKTNHLHDITAITASEDSATGLVANLVPAGAINFALRATSDTVNELPAVKEWFDIINAAIHRGLATSNFMLHFYETVRSAVTFGTGCLFSRKGKRTPVTYRDFPIGKYVVAENDDGEVDTLYYRFPLTALQCAERAEDEGWVFDKSIIDASKEETKMNETFWFVQAVEPNKKFNAKFVNNTSMAWSETIVDEKHKTIVHDSGFEEFPFFVVRWQKASDEVMGRGAGTKVLPIVRKLNVAERDRSEAGNKHVNPALEILDSFQGDVKTFPGAQNFVSERDTIKRQDSAGDYPLGSDYVEEQRDVIKKAYFIDLFNLLTEERTQVKTAFETNAIIIEKQQRLGGPVWRLSSELLVPLITRHMNLLQRQELIPVPPEELQGQEFDIELLGPLALALRNTQTVGFARLVDMVLQIAPIVPDVVDNVEFNVGVRDAGRAFGAKHTVLRDVDEVASIRAERAAAEQAAAQAEQAAQLAQVTQAVPNLNQAPEEGSIMQELQSA